MAIYSTPANKVKAFRLYSNESLSNPDSDNSGGESSGIYNTVLKPTTMAVCISGALVIYTKA
jgi:hypothetical protein